MSENVVNTFFYDFQKELDSGQEIRETIRTVCKDIDRISREITTVLQAIHRSEEQIAPACLESRKLFDKAREAYQQLKEAVPAADFYKYYENWRGMNQRYSFLISLTIWLEVGIMANYETVAAVLGISAVDREGFHLNIEDYLIGLLNLCSELTRLAVNSVTRGEYSRPLQVSKFVSEVNAGFRVLNLKNDHLRKRFEGLRHDIRKIEEVVYDLSIRGLKLPLEKEATLKAEATE